MLEITALCIIKGKGRPLCKCSTESWSCPGRRGAQRVQRCSWGQQSPVPLALTCKSPMAPKRYFRSGFISGNTSKKMQVENLLPARSSPRAKENNQNSTSKKTTNTKSIRVSCLHSNSCTREARPNCIHPPQLHHKAKALRGLRNTSILNSIYVPLTIKPSFLLLLPCSHFRFTQTFANEQ